MNNSKLLSSYLDELENNWQQAYQEAQKQIEANETPTAIVDCVHNALLRSSLNTFAENLTPKIVARLFETDLWTIEDILTLISVIPDHYRKAQNYIALLETGKLDKVITPQVRDDAFKTANAIDFAPYRSGSLEELAKYGDETEKLDLLTQSIEAAFADANHYYESGAYNLLDLIQNLPESMLQELEPRIITLKYANSRAWALSHLARRTTGDHKDQLLKQGLEAASQIKSDVNIANALAQLGYQLSGELIPKALELGRRELAATSHRGFSRQIR